MPPDDPPGPLQLELAFDGPSPAPERPRLRVIEGGGQRVQEPLASRDSVVRVLIEAGADLLLRRISSARAQEIEQRVDRILALFDRVDADPTCLPRLREELDALEALMTETRRHRRAR